MPVIVGNGRCGTNVALEILTGSSYLKPSLQPEDKKFFKRNCSYPLDYLTKTDTVYFELNDIERFIEINQYFKIIWMIRDPRDMCMSKMRRGVPVSDGGDCIGYAEDSTPDGCVEDMKKMFNIYMKIKDKVKLFKMEEILVDVKGQAKSMCEFVNVPYEESMPKFYNRMRNTHKRSRYKNIDLTQIGLWKNWKTSYDGWLTKYDMESIFKKINHITLEFGYESSDSN